MINKKARRISAGTIAVSTAALIITSLAVPASAANNKTPAFPSASIGGKSSAATNVATDRFIVKFNGTAKTSPGERGNAYGKAARNLGISVKEVKETAEGAEVVKASKRLSDNDMKSLLQNLQSDPSVAYAEADTLLQPALTPNDPYYSSQWDDYETAGGINLPAAWDKTTGAGQVIAVIDTGITSHSDLNANMLPGYDFISDATAARDGDGRDANPQDQGDWRVSGDCGSTATANSSWHGTHVAGIVAALGNNSNGVAGTAYGAKVLPLRALGLCGGYLSDVSDAVIWASGGSITGVPANPTPAQTISMSLGAPGSCSTTMQSAIDSAVNRGSTVFIAAGNNNVDASTFTPASCSNAITVAASGREGNRAYYSNYGSAVDITAPGGDSSTSGGYLNSILSTWNDGTTTPGAETYAYMSGTSMATPKAAAVGALMKAADPSLTPAAIEAKLKSTARPISTCTVGCGAGLIDASQAVVVAAPVVAGTLTTAVPTISGTAAVGSTLTASAGTWGPAPVTLAYQWKRNGAAISGATAATYTATSADAGTSLSVTVTGTKTGYTTASTTSAGTASVAQATLSYSTPTISGITMYLSTLRANPGTWTSGTSFTYQWYRSGVAIPGATASSYKLAKADRGQTIKVRVTGSKSGYQSVSVYSASTATIQ